MAEMHDARLEQLLRTGLRTAVQDLPVTVRPEDILRRRSERAAPHRSQPWRLLAFAAALALPLAAIIGIALTQPDADEGDVGAVIVRGLDPYSETGPGADLEVILARSDGTADGLARYSPSHFDSRSGRSRGGWLMPVTGVLDPTVSPSGWLAFKAEDSRIRDELQVIQDLTVPFRPPIRFVGPAAVAWSPDGMLWRHADGAYERIDPESGRRTSVTDMGLAGYSPLRGYPWGLVVAADGSGILVTNEALELGPGIQRSWGVVNEDGALVEGLPDVVADGTRPFSSGDDLLSICDTHPAVDTACPRGTVISTPAIGGPARTWAPAPGPYESVLDVSWAADGGVWKLVDRRADGRTLALVHVDADGEERDTVTFAAEHWDIPTIGGLSPDDSVIATEWLDESGWWTALSDTRTGRTHLFQGQLAGFVDAAAAVDWMPGSFSVALGQALPEEPLSGAPAYPPLVTEETQLAGTGAKSVLLAHEVPATASDPGSPVSVTIGPVQAESGVGISLVCSGPGNVSYLVEGGDVAVSKHCQDPFLDDRSTPNQPPGDISVIVTAEPSTAWRLVIYDPPHQELRPRAAMAQTSAAELRPDDVAPGAVGVAAIGHSGLTGEGADPARAGSGAPSFAHSWATGDAPEVESIYRRLVAALPETADHVANAASGGAHSSMLLGQAEAVLAEVPTPALAIIQSIDNDIRCDGSDDAGVADFGRNVAATLDLISSRSPETHVLMLGQQGRPATGAPFLTAYPEVVAAWAGTGMCDFFGPGGQIVPEAIETLTGIIEAYEAEQARVCATVPRCHTDDGLLARYVDIAEDYSSDWNHLSVDGQAHKAAMLWPLVVEILDLPTDTALDG